MLKGKLLLAATLLVLAGCSTVTITTDNSAAISPEPTYQVSKPHYLWGLVGNHALNVDTICGAGNTLKLQSETSFSDGVISTLSLGLYQPRTAKVWCGAVDAEQSL